MKEGREKKRERGEEEERQRQKQKNQVGGLSLNSPMTLYYIV